MSVATVLVLPGGDAAARTRLGSLVGGGQWRVLEVQPLDGPASALSVRVCAAIASLAPTAPVVVAAAGDGALLLPAVARAQRAAHRLVAEYLLVRPDVPPVTETWPDAPVTVVLDDAEDLLTATVRLRGWTLLVGADPWQPRE